jgi:hypothetical protein
MKVVEGDCQTIESVDLERIELAKFTAYLRAHGWYEDRPFLDHAMIWLLQSDDTGEVEILLPLTQNLRDYRARIQEALQTLELVEHRSQFDILGDLLTVMPNTTVQGVVTNLYEGVTSGKVTLMGVVAGKLHRIQLELMEPTYELAIKAYQARIPVLCQGDLVKQGRSFKLQNVHHLTLDLEAWMD